MAFCDECGSQYLRATSKWCSECGASRDMQVDEAREVVLANVGGNELQGILEEPPISHLWYLSQAPNLTLYDRVYGQRVKGLPRDITWGKSFLKQHHCYKKQHQKQKKNQEIVRSWFLPGKNEFVDEFQRSSSLRWNPEFLKKLQSYCRKMRSSGDIDERIVDIKFPEDGTKLCWRGSDILRYVFEIKHYRKSSRSIPRSARLTTEEVIEETQAIMPASTSFVPSEEGVSSPEALPLSPLNPNVEVIPQAIMPTLQGKEPRRKRRPTKFRDL